MADLPSESLAVVDYIEDEIQSQPFKRPRYRQDALNEQISSSVQDLELSIGVSRINRRVSSWRSTPAFIILPLETKFFT